MAVSHSLAGERVEHTGNQGPSASYGRIDVDQSRPSICHLVNNSASMNKAISAAHITGPINIISSAQTSWRVAKAGLSIRSILSACPVEWVGSSSSSSVEQGMPPSNMVVSHLLAGEHIEDRYDKKTDADRDHSDIEHGDFAPFRLSRTRLRAETSSK